MIVMKHTYHRPATSVQWHTEVIDINQYSTHFLRYREEGKILSHQTFESDDSLSKTFTIVFDSQESLDQYRTDVNLAPLWNEKNIYNTEHNITRDTPEIVVL